jgi:hypothetical protein
MVVVRNSVASKLMFSIEQRFHAERAPRGRIYIAAAGIRDSERGTNSTVILRTPCAP